MALLAGVDGAEALFGAALRDARPSSAVFPRAALRLPWAIIDAPLRGERVLAAGGTFSPTGAASVRSMRP